MSSTDMLREEFKDLQARRDYAEILLNSSLALQIKVLRQQRGWNQEQLAEAAGLGQSQVSVVEQASNATWSFKTLKKLAAAFDLALVVRFESFGTLLDQTSSLSRASLERPSFEHDPVFSEKTVAKAVQSPSDTGVVVNLRDRQRPAAIGASAKQKVITADMPQSLLRRVRRHG